MIRRPPRSTLFPTRRSSDLVALRGNTVMKGYLRNPAANDAAFAGGWFHTGDLGVLHPDGYIEVKDRAKDIVISGGENISSLEVEEVRSEEHTSELQSRQYLVCRLLLEKKKILFRLLLSIT